MPEIETAQTNPAGGITCPGCHAWLPARQTIGDEGRIVCSGCGWRGDTFFFSPIPIDVEQAQTALPDEAACVNHPTKKAVHTCAGTGDYICSLCAVEIADQIFSASYVDQHGETALKTHFDTKLDRPDRLLMLVMLMGLIFSWALIGALAIPIAPFFWWRMAKRRNHHELYAKLFSQTNIIIAFILMLLGIGLIVIIDIGLFV